MHNILKNTLFALSIIFAQIILPGCEINYIEKSPKTIKTRTHNFNITPEANEYLVEATPQIVFPDTIIVDNAHYNDIMMILFKDELKIYNMTSDFSQLKDTTNIGKEQCIDYTISENPIFHIPEINFKSAHLKNKECFFINAEKSVEIADCLMEMPKVILKNNIISLYSTLVGVQTFELQSDNPNSLLSKIKLTLKSNTNLAYPMEGDVDFDYNFMVLYCAGVSKVEIQCLPGSFYLNDRTVCFN